MSQATFDLLHRFLFENRHIRGELVQLDSSYQQILAGHDYPDVVAKILGEALAATSLLTATLKFEGEITLQIQGNGPMSLLVINGRNDQTMRGIARLQGDVAADASFHQLIGQGQMVITIAPDAGERYQGIIALDADTLTACIENYFIRSEQLATQLKLFANPATGRCGGILLQALPGEFEQQAEDFEHLSILSETLTEEEALTLPAEQLLFRLFHEEQVKLYPEQAVSFKCTCSRERCRDALISMGEQELSKLFSEQEEVDIHCHYCHSHHVFTSDDLQQMLGKDDSPLH